MVLSFVLAVALVAAPTTGRAKADPATLMARGAWRKALPLLDAKLANATRDEEIVAVQLARGLCLAALNQAQGAKDAFAAALARTPAATLDPKASQVAQDLFAETQRARKGKLVVATEAGATVRVDGEVKGTGPLVVELSPGHHAVEVTADDGRFAKSDAEVMAGSSVTVEAPLPVPPPRPAPIIEAAPVIALRRPDAAPTAIVTKGKTVAFLSVREGAGVDAKTAASVTSYVEGQLGSLGYARVTSSAQVQQMLGIERSKQILGCADEASSAACMGELAGALDASHVLGGELSKLGDSYVLTLLLTDGRNGGALARGTRRAERGDMAGLLEEVQPMLEGMYSGDAKLATGEVSARGFIVGARVDLDLAGAITLTPGITPLSPGLTAEWSSRRFGVALSVLLLRPNQFVVAGRLEGRFFPLQTRIRPWVALGATGFSDLDFGLHAGLGVGTPIGPINVALDGGVEWFPLNRPGVQRLAGLIGLRLGWQLN